MILESLKQCPQLSGSIDKCKSIATFVYKSTIATDKLEEERRLLTANTTRWYSGTVSSQCFAFPRRSLILCNFPPNSLPLTATF